MQSNTEKIRIVVVPDGIKLRKKLPSLIAVSSEIKQGDKVMSTWDSWDEGVLTTIGEMGHKDRCGIKFEGEQHILSRSKDSLHKFLGEISEESHTMLYFFINKSRSSEPFANRVFEARLKECKSENGNAIYEVQCPCCGRYA